MTPGLTYTQANFYATEIGDPGTSWASGLYRGVWYQVTPPAGARCTISSCDSDFNTRMAVYTGGCTSLVEWTGNDNNGPACTGSDRASVNFLEVGGRTYYILVGSSGPSVSGTCRIVAAVAPPDNDTCAGIIPLTAGIPSVVSTLNSGEAGDPTNTCIPGLRGGVWFSYTPTVSGPVAIDTCASDFDVGLALYSGTCANLVPEQCVPSDRSVCNNGRPSLTFNAVAGRPYCVLAGGRNGAAGNLRILLNVVDLVSTNLTATNTAGGLLTAGRPASFGWSVFNQGQNTVSTYWTDRLSLSNAATNLVIAEFSGGRSVVPGGSYGNARTLTLPQIPAGTYSLIAQADANNQVTETNELNNVQILTVVVTNIAPTIILTSPTEDLLRTNCILVRFFLSATGQDGSYPLDRVEFYSGTNLIGMDPRSRYALRSDPLGHGDHAITAQAVDAFGLRGTSQVVRIVIVKPGLLHMAANLATNGEVVCCMGAQPGSNYVIEAATLMHDHPAWAPHLTNRPAGDLFLFTNSLPLLPQRYFRGRPAP
jgi:hypothetical protein